MFKKIFLILISIILIFSFIPPLTISAQEVNWPLKQNEVENLLDIIRKEPLAEANFDLFFESIEGYEPNSPRKTGAIVLVKQAILKEQFDYWFKQVPKELSIKFIKTAFKVIPLIYSQDISGVINFIEKLSVQKATDYAIEWLLQNEIKIGSGELSYSFYSYKGNWQEIKIQYIVVYHSLGQNRGEIITEFYSKNPIEPPLGTNPWGCPDSIFDHPKSICFPWDYWLENERKGNNDGKLEPFILRVKGYVTKDRWGRFDWDDNKSKPVVEIDFDNPVPEIENSDFILANPPSKISFAGEMIKLFWEKLKSKTSEVTTNFLDIIKGYFSSSKPEAQISEQIGEKSQSSPPPEEATPPELTKEEISEVEEILEEMLEQEVSGETPLTLEELKERLDEISERANILIAQIQKLLAEKAPSQPEEELEEEEEEPEEEPEEEIIICSLSDARYSAMNKVVFNEIAWMGTKNSSNDEWLELRNITGTAINLNGWQILDKDIIEGKTGGIKIIFGNATISSGGFFLLERTDDSSVPNISADLIYTGSLNNTNEALYLFDKNCILQDKAEANPNWPAGDNSSKRTMERNPTNLGWQTSSNPGGTPKAKNSSGYYESPEEKTSKSSDGGGSTLSPSPSYPKILISEVRISPITERFVELYNPNNQTVDLTKWYIHRKVGDGEPSTFVSSSNFEGKTIEPFGYFLITNASSTSATSADILLNLTLTPNNTLFFKNPAREIVDEISLQKIPEGFSYGLIWDDSKNSYSDNFGILEPTPKAKNKPKQNQPPIASFTFSPQNPFVGDSILFDASSSTDSDDQITTYVWDFGDGTTTTIEQATTSHSFLILDQFQIALIVTDNQGTTSTPATTTITISGPESYSPLDIVINEIAWMGTKADYNDEWIELYNNTNKEINLNNWTINWGEGTSTRSISLTRSIPAYGFYLLERTASTTISDIEEDQIYTGALKNIKISGGKYSGEKLELLSPNSELIDTIDCSKEWFAGDNDNKYTMERINPRLSGDNPANWANNDGITINGLDAGNNPILGTPKAKNSVFATSSPNPVPNFSLDEENSKYNTVVLTWSTTTDQDTPEQDISYIIYWAKEVISEENASATNPIAFSTSTATTTLTLSTLDYNSTYYFGIRAFDGENYSPLSTTTPYNTPLPPINDLNAGTSAIREAIDLFWASNGAKSYLIKYAEKEIVENGANENQINWENANFIENSLIPNEYGKIESFTVKNLTPNITYYFAVKSINQADAASILSNSPKAKAIPGFIDNGDETITDLYTGLIWVKDGMGLGANNGEGLTWDEAKTFCEQLNFAGYDDWRLPNFKELASIVDYGKNNPAIDQNYFPNTTSSNYWSSSYILYPGEAYAYPASWDIEIVDFNNGSIVVTLDKNALHYLRPVRGPDFGMPNILSPTGLEGDPPGTCNLGYAENDDGTVIDNCTGLVWIKGGTRILIGSEPNYPLSPRPKTISWKDAINLCSNLTTAGYNDWHLPNVRELINVSNKNGSIILPWESGYSYGEYYWSSTSAGNNAWGMGNGYNAGRVQILSKDNGVYIQCLRDNE